MTEYIFKKHFVKYDADTWAEMKQLGSLDISLKRRILINLKNAGVITPDVKKRLKKKVSLDAILYQYKDELENLGNLEPRKFLKVKN